MKNFMFSQILLLMTVMSAQVAHAAPSTNHKVGNGGDAVVCYTASDRTTITSVQMFEYWEMEQVLHYPGGINLGGPTATIEDKINTFTNRIAAYQPSVAEQIKKIALVLNANISSYLVTSYQLPEIDDAHPKAIPNTPNCFIEQYAVQWREVLSGQRRFAIADKFFNAVVSDNDAKAGIILHEAIYRWAILSGPIGNSDGVRYFNYVMATNKSSSVGYTSANYLKLLDDAQFNYQNCAMDSDGDIVKPQMYSNRWSICITGRRKYGPQTFILPEGIEKHKVQPASQSSSYESNRHLNPVITLEAKTGGVSTVAPIESFAHLPIVNSPNGIEIVLHTYDTSTVFLNFVGPKATNIPCSNKSMITFDSRVGFSIDMCESTGAEVTIDSKTYAMGNMSKSMTNTGLNYRLLMKDTPTADNSFKLLGTQINQYIKAGTIEVNDQNEAFSGSVSLQTLLLNGTPTQVYASFKIINNEFIFKPIPVSFNLFNGLKILSAKGYWSNLDVRKFCQLQGFNSVGSAYPRQYFVTAPENFYTTDLENIVEKVDEEVTIVDSVYCELPVAHITQY